jgi:biopolymer transport protein ExbB
MTAPSTIGCGFTSSPRIGILWELIGMTGARDLWLVAVAVLVGAAACRFDLPPAMGGDAAMDGAPPGDASTEWWDEAWTRRRKITIKSADLTGPVQSFPLLVRLPQGVGRPGGEDLRFVATDQRTLLPYELDTAPLSGALVWVRIPEISNTDRAPVVWVYYGNDAAPSTSSGAAVFADGHVSVHHMGPTLAGPTLPDATGNGHNASAPTTSMPALRANGRIGEARAFDGTNDHLELAGEAAYDFTTSFTVSAWIRVQSLSSAYQAIVCKGDRTWRLHRAEQTSFVGFGTTANNVNHNSNGTTSIDDSQWHHVAIVLGSSTKRIYVDGRLDKTDTVGATIDVSDLPVLIGRNAEAPTVPDRFWHGDIDEVRISSVARDAHWIFAEHHTVASVDFAQVGAEEELRP